MTMQDPGLWIRFIDKSLNRVLEFDPETRRDLAALEGKTIEFVLPRDVHFYLTIGPDRIRVGERCDAAADATLQGTVLAFASAFRGGGADAFASGDIEISGDVEFVHEFSAIVGGLDIDWEEPLAQVVGDMPARQAGNLVRTGLGWMRSAGDSIERNVAEYLQEERRDLAARPRIERLLDDIDTLRSDVDRTAQRVERLAANISKQ
ncbi:MAG: SCP2 sterol-binding domain-containing protein [Gammaproteobacteria bacterium]|nr:SCP2 sterol-binding domain-containing protein [Gammaproteobacteria bacterium]MDH3468679.1 SCP2 sterol-binding domain-containing protein [Gammaproteobacteria bacterium]